MVALFERYAFLVALIEVKNRNLHPGRIMRLHYWIQIQSGFGRTEVDKQLFGTAEGRQLLCLFHANGCLGYILINSASKKNLEEHFLKKKHFIQKFLAPSEMKLKDESQHSLICIASIVEDPYDASFINNWISLLKYHWWTDISTAQFFNPTRE